MSFFKWNDDLETKIKWIDAQHMELISKANALVKAFDEQKGKEEILNTLRFLEDYVLTHFREEEELQIKYNYPYYSAHKAMHDAFIIDFKKLKNQALEYGPSTYMVFEVKERLIAWIVRHINQVDKAMADYLLQYTDINK